MATDRQVRVTTGGMAPGGGREATPGAVDQAVQVLDQAEARLRRWDTPLEAALLAVVDRRWTDEVATMAVQLRPDGIATLLANPAFVTELGADGTAFVLCHEALHLLLDHLRFAGIRDDAWRLACEVVINHWVTRSTGRLLPRSRRTGEPVGVDPRAVHRDHLAAGAEPVTYDDFVRTDEECAQLLRQRPIEAPLPAPSGDCAHRDHQPTPTPSGAGEAVEEVLEAAVVRAQRGDEVLRRQLLDLEEVVPGAPAWSRVGVSELRATTQRAGATRLWEQQLAHVLGQTLTADLEVRYDRKVGWWDAGLLAPLGIVLDPQVGMPLQLAPAVRRQRQVAIYLDTSGSVSDAVVEATARTVGRIPDTIAHWRTFDHEVHPFTPGEELPGGGGTSFEAVAEDVVALDDDLDDPLDAVLVLTDGYAEPIAPPRPERWIWLIVADGDTWPRDRGMRTVPIPHLERT